MITPNITIDKVKIVFALESNLEDLWEEINSLSRNNFSTDYSTIMNQITTISGYLISFLGEGKISYQIDESGSRGNFGIPSINDSIMNFPPNCSPFINYVIKISRGEELKNQNYDSLLSFISSFNCFFLWLINSDEFNKIFQDKENSEILQRVNNFKNHIVNSDEDFSEENYDHWCSTQDSVIQNEENFYLSMLEKKFNDFQQQLKSIENKVDSISQKLDSIVNQIECYQTLIEKQIDLAQSASEKDRIIHAYVDECCERIIRETNSNNLLQNKQTEERKLIEVFTETTWELLEDNTKNFLITAKVIYNQLINISNCVDFSSVVLLVSKSLEVEISKRFCKNFIIFLKSKYGKNYSIYPTALLGYEGKPKRQKDFTLGNAPFLLDPYRDTNLSPSLVDNNKNKLIEYCKARLLPNLSDEQIIITLKEYADKIADIAKDYRNPSAHTNEITLDKTIACFNLIIDVEKFLKKMLDSFSE